MKALKIQESTEFKRKEDTKSGLDVGIQRSQNPNNFANADSYKLKLTNEDFLNKIMNELEEFTFSVVMDITDPDEKGNPTFEPPQLEFFKRSFIEVESKIEGMIRALKSIKR